MRKLSRSLLWSGLVLAGVGACGDDVTIPVPPPPPPATVHSISVAPNGVSMVAGTTLQMNAAVNADATVATTVTWSSSSTTITISATGVVTAPLTITANTPVAITACSTVVPTVCGNASITVVPPTSQVPTGVTIVPGTVNPAQRGTTTQLVASVQGLNNPAQTVAWQTSPNPAIATVSATGLVTIPANAPAGTVTITACSTIAGFTNVCGSAAFTTAAITPATVSLQGITWIPQTPGTCAPIAGQVPQAVTLTNVNCQVEVTANVNAGDQQLSRVDVLFGGQVVASQTFPGTAPVVEGPEAVSAPVDITMSVNTRQLKDAGTAKVPVIINGNKGVSLNLYVVGSATPLASNSVPVVMNNIDAFFVTPGIDGPSLLRTAVVAPAPVVAGGATWFKGTQTATGNFIAYSGLTPTAFNYAASTVCGGTTPAGATLAGTAATGITVTGVFTCAGVEGQNFLGAVAPASVLTYGVPTGPDGTVLAGVAPCVAGPPAVTNCLTYFNVGSAYTVPTGTIAAPAPESRYNPIALAVNPSGFIDNRGPTADVAGSTTWNANVPAATGRIIAFNSLFDQWWINASYTFGACTTAACSGAANAASRIWAVDGGVGMAAGFPIAKVAVQSASAGSASDTCTGATVASGADLAVTVTSLADAHRLCAYAEDLLANASATVSAAASAATRALAVSFSTNLSNRAGVDKEVPVLRFAGSTAATPALATASTVSATANTTIYNILAPRPAHVFGIEAQDTRSGFHQGAALAGLPATQTIVRTISPSPAAGGITQPCGAIVGSLATLLSDTWVRSVTSAIDCGLAGALGVGYWAYSSFVTDRAGNVSVTVARNYAADDVAAPAITGLGFAAALYTPGAAAPFGFSANDDVEIIGGTLAITQYMANPASAAVGPSTPLRYPEGALTALGTRWDVDCTLLQPNCVFTNVLNGSVASIPYFIFRVDVACTAAGIPYASCTAPGTIATPPAGAAPLPPAAAPYYLAPVAKTAANYLTAPHPTTNVAYLPLNVRAGVSDVGGQISQLAAPGAPMLATQFSPATGIAAPWATADVLSWSGTSITPSPGPPAIAGGVTAVHVASTSILVPLFTNVSLWRLNDLDASGTLTAGDEWVYCNDFPAPALTDNGSNRFWTYNTAYPITGACRDAALPVFRPFRVGGSVSGAMLMTPNF
ncbi:MAG: hypothetical protein HOP28_09125 [Gemmatimonadales bacterium]|nr:hypothetical protein [Gemmatimonadales bacterium]